MAGRSIEYAHRVTKVSLKHNHYYGVAGRSLGHAHRVTRKLLKHTHTHETAERSLWACTLRDLRSL